MAIVYRVECNEGYGPYRSPNTSSDWRHHPHACSTRHPTPWEDGITEFGDDHLCGFAYMHHLEDWFHPLELAALTLRGFRLATYEIDSRMIRYGHRQCMFDRRYAHKTNQSSLIGGQRVQPISLTPLPIPEDRRSEDNGRYSDNGDREALCSTDYSSSLWDYSGFLDRYNIRSSGVVSLETVG